LRRYGKRKTVKEKIMGSFLLQIVYICTIGCSAYTGGWLILKAGRNRAARALAACQFLVMIWCLPLLFTGFLTTRAMKYLAYGISYAGISFIGPAWLLFSLGYCEKRLGGRGKALLFGISTLNYAMFFTNEIHHLFYREFSVNGTVYGPVFYVHMLYTYLCVLGGMAVVFREFMKKRVTGVQMAVIVLTGVVPLGFNFLYLSGTIQSGFDLTPPAFAWSAFLMLSAVLRHDFLDVNPMAFERIFDSIAEGAVICDRRGRLTYCNQAARRWIGIVDTDTVGEIEKKLCAVGFPEADRTLDGRRTAVEGLRASEADGRGAADKEAARDVAGRATEAVLPDGTRLRLRTYQYRDEKGQIAASAMILTDVSEFYEILRQSQELEFSSSRLAVEKERNRIAQEVHDTTGHTLTMIQSLLRLARAELAGKGTGQAGKMAELAEKEGGRVSENASADDGNDAPILEYLSQAQELAAGGIRELRCSINELRKKETMTVTQSIQMLAESVKEIPVETEFRGEDGPEYSALSPVVYGVLREGITNCLKYADASRMDVIARFERESLSLYIFDDGKGCDTIQENNGIRGIRQRVESAGGTVRFLSSAGEGFQIYVNLPIKEKRE